MIRSMLISSDKMISMRLKLVSRDSTFSQQNALSGFSNNKDQPSNPSPETHWGFHILDNHMPLLFF
jgi:hypothetical protein